MPVVKAVGSLARQDMGCNEGDILAVLASKRLLRRERAYSKRHRRKLVVLSNREGQQAFVPGLLRVQKQILGVETSTGKRSSALLQFFPSKPSLTG